MVAAVRPDEWNLPLFLHVLGAMTLVGTFVVAVVAFAGARAGAPGAHRLGFRALLWAGVPSYLVMRIFAQVIADKEKVSDSDAAWITIGYIVTEPGLLFIIVAIVASGIAAKRVARGEEPRKLVTAAMWCSSLLLLLYMVALWAMTTKPE